MERFPQGRDERRRRGEDDPEPEPTGLHPECDAQVRLAHAGGPEQAGVRPVGDEAHRVMRLLLRSDLGAEHRREKRAMAEILRRRLFQERQQLGRDRGEPPLRAVGGELFDFPASAFRWTYLTPDSTLPFVWGRYGAQAQGRTPSYAAKSA